MQENQTSLDQPIPKKKHAGGRPPIKKEDVLPSNWKQIIMEKCAEGWSEAEIKAHLCMKGKRFSDPIWDSLKEKDAEFVDAIRKGKVLCEAWWTKQSRKGIRSKHFQSFLWFCNMKNRFGWKDKTEIDHGVTDETYEKMEKYGISDIAAALNQFTSRSAVVAKTPDAKKGG